MFSTASDENDFMDSCFWDLPEHGSLCGGVEPIARAGGAIGCDIILEVQGIPISMDLHDLKKIRDTIADKSDLSGIAFKVLRAGKVVVLQRSY